MAQLIILVVMVGALYAFMIVPQQRRMKEHQQLLRSLEEGDVVITGSGIYGAVAEVEDDVVWLEVAPEIELKFAKTAITEKVVDQDEDEFDEDDVDDDDDHVDDEDIENEAMADADDES